MQFKSIIAFMLLGAAAVTSCTVDEIPVPSEELYMREFIKEFGVIAADHDWNLAQHSSVTVQTSTPTHVKIIAEVNGKRYLFADYHGVEGTKEIPFTVPKGVSNVIVRTPSRDITTTLGSSVDLRSVGSRIVADPSSEGHSGVTAELCTDRDDWMVVPLLNATVFTRKIPEKAYNAHRDGVSVDFSFKFNTHDIIVRPLYWQTLHTHDFGFFYIGDDGKPVHFPVYKMEKTSVWSEDLVLSYVQSQVKEVIISDFANNQDLLECFAHNSIEIVEKDLYGTLWKLPVLSSTDNFKASTTSLDDRNMTYACREYLEKIGIKPGVKDGTGFNYVYRWEFCGDTSWDDEAKKTAYKDLKIVYTYYNYDDWKAFGTNTDMVSGLTLDSYFSLVSKGIKVHFDDIDKTYGGYIKTDDGRYLYSVSSLNEKTRWVPKPDAVPTWDGAKNAYVYKDSDFMIDEENKAFRAATWVGTKYSWRYMSFEDGKPDDKVYNSENCDFDMQDFVFLIDGAEPDYDDPVKEVVTPKDDPDPEPYMWIIAAEDLGGSYDWDFNDLVVGVSTLSCMWDGVGKDISEYTEVTIHPLASGGTMPIYLMYTGRTCTSKEDAETATEQTYVVGQEFHSWFNHPTTKAVNVGATAGTSHTGTVTFLVPGEFTLADTHNQHYNGSNMGGFWVLVDKNGSNVSLSGEGPLHPMTTIPEGQGITMVTAPDPSKGATAPQMICVESHWLWPREFTDIRKAYPKDGGRHGFEGWVDHTVTDGSWYGEGKHESRFVTAR